MRSNEMEGQGTGIRLLIVDDSQHVREDLRRLLELTDQVKVVGEAKDGADALRQAESLRPETVLMGLEMPVLDGWEATRRIKARNLADRVVVLTIHVDQKSTDGALRAGADAILPKGAELEEILAAISGRDLGRYADESHGSE